MYTCFFHYPLVVLDLDKYKVYFIAVSKVIKHIYLKNKVFI